MIDKPAFLAENHLFHGIFNASPAGMVITDLDGKIRMVNQQALEWFGYREEELLGKFIEILIPTAHRGAHTAHRARYMNHMTPRSMAKGRDLFSLCKDGTEFPVDISLHPLETPAEKLILANILDASLRQQAQRVPKERLAAIGEMVTGLAHESRNALQRARGCLDLLELDLDDDSEQRDLTRRIRQSLEDLERNYEEVRNYAAPIMLDRASLDLSHLLQESFDDLRFESGADNVTLHIEVSDGAVVNWVDKHRLKQVFRNLIENAISASAPDSELWARFKIIHVGDQLWQQIQFSDSGAGLSPELCSRIFAPFFTTKQAGTGLGLAICQRIVEAHAGTIRAIVSNEPGLTIQIDLPLIRRDTE